MDYRTEKTVKNTRKHVKTEENKGKVSKIEPDQKPDLAKYV